MGIVENSVEHCVWVDVRGDSWRLLRQGEGLAAMLWEGGDIIEKNK